MMARNSDAASSYAVKGKGVCGGSRMHIPQGNQDQSLHRQQQSTLSYLSAYIEDQGLQRFRDQLGSPKTRITVVAVEHTQLRWPR